ncbi:hypothetical protein PIB30_014084 [Stylosanthes scabra]|uniref:Uncharacterized protein n=1 Tax=Stylosanthes scabra TaxID=79078 RepID=A0ABU6R6T3_9FABA|nr:hypothetical protein [Stylosanthes scabra]
MSSQSNIENFNDETRGNELGNTSTSHTIEPSLSSVRHDGVGHALLRLSAAHLNSLGSPPYALLPGVGMAVESAVNNSVLKELVKPAVTRPTARIPVITVVNPCRRALTIASRGVRIAVTDLTPFLPSNPMGDSQLRSFAYFTPQPRHYGTLLAT